MTNEREKVSNIADFLTNPIYRTYKFPGIAGIILVHSASQEEPFRESALKQGYEAIDLKRNLVGGTTVFHTYLTYDVDQWQVTVFSTKESMERKAEIARRTAEGWSWEAVGSRIIFHKPKS